MLAEAPILEATSEEDDETLPLLRIATAGSVDDGKSTLVGRLLYDSKSLFDDQIDALERSAVARGAAGPDLAFITDGLRAEREQGITIDVAYRYFSTPRRKFIIADTPGHLQYTRNMVTGASTADLAIVLVDARHGIVTQSRRHGYLSALLGIPHLLVAINKMDLVDYDETIFRSIQQEFTDFLRRAAPEHRSQLTFIPISALHGDNVVEGSQRMAWYRDASLIETLESVRIAPQQRSDHLRLPVQIAVRPNQDFRGFAGMVASGRLRSGDQVTVLPLQRTSRVLAILNSGEVVDEAVEGDSVVVTLEDAIDVSRGDLLAHPAAAPLSTTTFTATLCWLAEEPLDLRTLYTLQHTTREVTARIDALHYRVEVDTLTHESTTTLGLNEIGSVTFSVSHPLCLDRYVENRVTGSFILVHPQTHNTVAAGLVENVIPATTRTQLRSSNVVWESAVITSVEREARNGHRSAVLWFTGLSGSGKSTIAQALERRLFAAGVNTFRLDGDNVRHGLNGDLGFSDADRVENIRRVAHVAQIASEQGAVVLCTFISPFRSDRALARGLLPAGRFIEIHVECALDECARRDPKGLYARALRGEIANFTGISSPYEAPELPELTLDTEQLTISESVERILELLHNSGIVANR